MTPSCRITVDGAPVHDVFMNRLVSCTVTDKQGASSDTVDIVLNDDPFAAIPRTGAVIQIWLGSGAGGMPYMGAFTLEEPEVQLFPHRMQLRGKAADHRGKGKENTERSWDNATLRDVVSDIAGERGLVPMIDEALGSHLYTWLGQQGESSIHFLERLADRLGALYSEKDGKLIFAARGSGLAVSGAALTGITITPAVLKPSSARIRWSDRAGYQSVKAGYRDGTTQQRKTVEEPSVDEGTAIYEIGETFADEAEAKLAAKAKAKELQRRTLTFSATIIGNPAARAGAPVTFVGCRPGVDGLPFIIDTATHKYSKSGYTTALTGETQV